MWIAIVIAIILFLIFRNNKRTPKASKGSKSERTHQPTPTPTRTTPTPTRTTPTPTRTTPTPTRTIPTPTKPTTASGQSPSSGSSGASADLIAKINAARQKTADSAETSAPSAPVKATPAAAPAPAKNTPSAAPSAAPVSADTDDRSKMPVTLLKHNVALYNGVKKICGSVGPLELHGTGSESSIIWTSFKVFNSPLLSRAFEYSASGGTGPELYEEFIGACELSSGARVILPNAERFNKMFNGPLTNLIICNKAGNDGDFVIQYCICAGPTPPVANAILAASKSYGDQITVVQ